MDHLDICRHKLSSQTELCNKVYNLYSYPIVSLFGNNKIDVQNFIFFRIHGRNLSTLVKTPGSRLVPQVLGPKDTIP